MKEQKRKEAVARNEKFANMTTAEKIAKIEVAPGNSTRQLAKLHALLAKENV